MVIEELPRKTPECWFQAVFQWWIRFFGPMRTIVTDQEGALVSDLCGTCCEKFDVDLDLGGSQGHTAAPVAERRIQIIQLTAFNFGRPLRRKHSRLVSTSVSAKLLCHPI